MPESEQSVFVPHVSLLGVLDEVIHVLLLCIRDLVAGFELSSQSNELVLLAFNEAVLD